MWLKRRFEGLNSMLRCSAQSTGREQDRRDGSSVVECDWIESVGVRCLCLRMSPLCREWTQERRRRVLRQSRGSAEAEAHRRERPSRAAAASQRMRCGCRLSERGDTRDQWSRRPPAAAASGRPLLRHCRRSRCRCRRSPAQAAARAKRRCCRRRSRDECTDRERCTGLCEQWAQHTLAWSFE